MYEYTPYLSKSKKPFGFATTVVGLVFALSPTFVFSQDDEDYPVHTGFEQALTHQIKTPEMPESVDLDKEIRLCNLLQKTSFASFGRYMTPIDVDKLHVLQEGSSLENIVNVYRPLWKERWNVEMPKWDYWQYRRGGRLARGLSPKNEEMGSRHDFGMQSVQPKNDDRPSPELLSYNTYRNVLRSEQLFPGKTMQALTVHCDNQGIYLVAVYEVPEDRNDFYLKLRQVFLGFHPAPDASGIIYNQPFWSKKKLKSEFSPTGCFILIDENGGLTRYASVKEGKYFGPQIEWNPDGGITKFEDIKEPKDSCEELWIEFSLKW